MNKKILEILLVIQMMEVTGKKSNLSFDNNILTINFDEKFIPRRGRINCSLNDNGKWRWFGTQFVVMKN